MGLKEEITTDLIAALSDPDDLGDAARHAVLHKKKAQSAKAGLSLDGNKSAETVSHNAELVVVSSFNAMEIASGIPASDVKITVIQTLVSADPAVGDSIDVEGCGSFRVITVGKDAANVTWVIQARKV